MLRAEVGARHPGTGRLSIRRRDLADLEGPLRFVQERPERVDHLHVEALQLWREVHR
jgi:hypothetical protein